MRKQFYQTALGNCCGLNLANLADCSLRKIIASFSIIFGTLSFPIFVRIYCHRFIFGTTHEAQTSTQMDTVI